MMHKKSLLKAFCRAAGTCSIGNGVGGPDVLADQRQDRAATTRSRGRAVPGAAAPATAAVQHAVPAYLAPKRPRRAYGDKRLGNGPATLPAPQPGRPASLARAIEVELDGVRICFIGRSDLLHQKLRSGSDPARRRSKRLQDIADAQGLLEDAPSLEAELSEAERAILASPT